MFNQNIGFLGLTGKIMDTDAGSINFGVIEYIGNVPRMVHHLRDYSTSNNTFTLENQSRWTTSHIDMIKNWKFEDDLYITQNQAFFSAYRFAIVNPRLQKAIPISLLREPLPIEDKMFFLLKIDPTNDVVTLSDGMEYGVYSHDHGTLRKFSENDRIILGFNSADNLDESTLDHYKTYILINTTCNSCIRANPM